MNSIRDDIVDTLFFLFFLYDIYICNNPIVLKVDVYQ